jgi:hypothetical protein
MVSRAFTARPSDAVIADNDHLALNLTPEQKRQLVEYLKSL